MTNTLAMKNLINDLFWLTNFFLGAIVGCAMFGGLGTPILATLLVWGVLKTAVRISLNFSRHLPI